MQSGSNHEHKITTEERAFTQHLYGLIKTNNIEEATRHLEDVRLFKEIPGQSSLYLALQQTPPNPILIRLLLTKGANQTLEYAYGLTGTLRLTLIEIAARNRQWDIVKVLGDFPTGERDRAHYGKVIFSLTELNIPDDEMCTIIMPLLHHPHINTHIKSLHGSTALHRAARHNLPKVFSLLLNYGWDANIKDAHGKTAVDYANKNSVLTAALSNYQIEKEESVQFTTTLYTFIRNNDLKAIQSHLQNCPIDPITNRRAFKELPKPEKSSLHLALETKEVEPATIKLLLEHGADKTRLERDPSCEKGLCLPIGIVARHGRWDIIQVFANYAPDFKDDAGYGGVLCWAIEERETEAAKALLKLPNIGHFCSIGTRDTALHIAVKTQQPEMVALLLDYGFDIHIKNVDGKSPLELAHENPVCLKVFADYQAKQAKLRQIKTFFHQLVAPPSQSDICPIQSMVDKECLFQYIDKATSPPKRPPLLILKTMLGLLGSINIKDHKDDAVSNKREKLLAERVFKLALLSQLAIFKNTLSAEGCKETQQSTARISQSYTDLISLISENLRFVQDAELFFDKTTAFILKDILNYLEKNFSHTSQLQEAFLQHAQIDRRLKTFILLTQYAKELQGIKNFSSEIRSLFIDDSTIKEPFFRIFNRIAELNLLEFNSNRLSLHKALQEHLEFLLHTKDTLDQLGIALNDCANRSAWRDFFVEIVNCHWNFAQNLNEAIALQKDLIAIAAAVAVSPVLVSTAGFSSTEEKKDDTGLKDAVPADACPTPPSVTDIAASARPEASIHRDPEAKSVATTDDFSAESEFPLPNTASASSAASAATPSALSPKGNAFSFFGVTLHPSPGKGGKKEEEQQQSDYDKTWQSIRGTPKKNK